MITGVVLVRNEERNIVDCLRSLWPYVDEIILNDMESTDRTVELARPFATKILSHPLIANFDAARNIAVPEARNEWLWFLDADERISERTGHLVRDVIRERGHECVAITIPFKTYFCGKWIQHCGWWPGYTMPRVLRRGHFRFSEQLHGGVHFNGLEIRLPPDPELGIEHFSYRDIEHYLEKFNRYTSVESQQLHDQGQLLNWEAAFRHMVRDWWQYYEGHEGFLEGQHGWILAWLAGQYRWFSHAKLLDRQERQLDYHVVPSLDGIFNVMKSEVARQRAANPELPLGIVWRSPIWDPSGYAEDSRIHLKSLALGDRELASFEIRWSDAACPLAEADTALLKALNRAERPKHTAAITSCIPSLVRPDPDAALNILRTTFETDRIPSDWLPAIDMFDEVWVFSEHNRISFQQGGAAPEKLRVLGSFVDTGVFTPGGRKRKRSEALRERFVFLSMFDWQLRKGWDVLLRAYCEEFAPADGVGLLLKVTRSHGHTAEVIQEQMSDVIRSAGYSMSDRPDIEILDAALTTDEIAALYRSVDAFVLASRGEGWGRPYMEAMAAGLPTIGTCGSGNLDFMTDENSFLVNAELATVPKAAVAEIPVYQGHRWLEPDVVDLRAKMRLVFTDEAQRKRLAKRAVRDMRTRFDIRHARDAVEANLRLAESRFLARQASCSRSRQTSCSRSRQTLGASLNSSESSYDMYFSDLPAVAESDIAVQLDGELFAAHSFANINEKLTLELGTTAGVALGVNRVRHNPTYDRQSPAAPEILPYVNRQLPNGPAVTIRHAFPPNWTSPEQGKWVHIQPWEFGALPVAWIEPLRDRVDEIWAPSEFVKRVYERSGIPSEQIHVIPWGVSPEVYNPKALPRLLPTEKTFRFLFVGGSVARKGIDWLIHAYTQEFAPDDDVGLVVKDLGTKTFYRFGNYRELLLQAAGDKNIPEVIYMEYNMTEGQLASLYASCHCLVAPYRGEGFGLPILEAMACGLAPIVPRGGASDDFVDETTGYLLNAHEVESIHEWRLRGVPTELSIDVAELRTTMRHAFEEREETKARGIRASKSVLAHFTWQNTARQMTGRIRELAKDRVAIRHTSQKRKPASLSLCVTFRNDERVLADCLGRLRPFVDEVVAVDIGSEDRSKAIASEYGARVYRDEWKDSFGHARNLAVVRATSDWILALDPWDQIDDPPARSMGQMLTGLDRDVLGVNLRVFDGELVEWQTRLFRNQNEILFDLRAGETVQNSIRRMGGKIVDFDIDVRRAFPSNSAELAERLRLSHVDLCERPGTPEVLLSLGRSHFLAGNYFHAECYFHEFLTTAGNDHPSRQTAWLLLVLSHRKKGDLHRALEAATSAIQQFPNDARFASELAGLRQILGGRARSENNATC
ncbi:MAG TPA: glycosyltransferase [Pirellulaceae bacterium]|nr:glycosyltransferase [Pirellulaceae bacterium]